MPVHGFVRGDRIEYVGGPTEKPYRLTFYGRDRSGCIAHNDAGEPVVIDVNDWKRVVPTLSERQTEGFSVRLDVDMTPELAKRLADRLRDLLINYVGDATDDEGWDAATASLDALVARAFNRQLHPLAEMVEVSGEDLWEDWVTFGEVIAAPTTEGAPT